MSATDRRRQTRLVALVLAGAAFAAIEKLALESSRGRRFLEGGDCRSLAVDTLPVGLPVLVDGVPAGRAPLVLHVTGPVTLVAVALDGFRSDPVYAEEGHVLVDHRADRRKAELLEALRTGKAHVLHRTPAFDGR